MQRIVAAPGSEPTFPGASARLDSRAGGLQRTSRSGLAIAATASAVISQGEHP